MLKSKAELEKKRIMNIVICDDSKEFVQALIYEIKNYAAKRDCYIETKSIYSAAQLLDSDFSDVNALFLDIHMPDMDGLSAAREIRKKNKNLIIVFVTGWPEYASAGYEVNAFRYLEKGKLGDKLIEYLDAIQEELRKNMEIIVVETRERTLETTVRNILYFEGTSYRSVLLHLLNQDEVIECTGRLADYEQKMAKFGFLRLQKSFLANMYNIVKINNYKAELVNGEKLNVSTGKYQEVCRQFLLWRGRRYE